MWVADGRNASSGQIFCTPRAHDPGSCVRNKPLASDAACCVLCCVLPFRGPMTSNTAGEGHRKEEGRNSRYQCQTDKISPCCRPSKEKKQIRWCHVSLLPEPLVENTRLRPTRRAEGDPFQCRERREEPRGGPACGPRRATSRREIHNTSSVCESRPWLPMHVSRRRAASNVPPYHHLPLTDTVSC